MPLVQSSTESSPHVEGSGGEGTHTEGSGTEANHQQDCVDSRQCTYKAEVLGSTPRDATRITELGAVSNSCITPA